MYILHVNFFSEGGDVLVCLTEVSPVLIVLLNLSMSVTVQFTRVRFT